MSSAFYKAEWDAFLQWIGRHSDARFVFRGLGDDQFALVPSIGRDPTYGVSKEKSVLEVFRRRACEFIGADALSEWDILALAQHFGVPTRLLDWSANPLIAAYFAVISPPRIGNLQDGAGVFHQVPLEPVQVDAIVVAYKVRGRDVIDLGANPDPFLMTGVGFVRPRSLAKRIVNQNAFFSCHSPPTLPWRHSVSTSLPAFSIPGPCRDFFRRRLYDLGIDAQSVMGGLEGLGQRLAWQVNSGVGLGPIR